MAGKAQFTAIREVAETTGVCYMTIRRAVERGEIPSIRIGKRILIPKDAVQRMLSGANQAMPVASHG